MKDFARYVILSSIVPTSAMARRDPSNQRGTPSCDPGKLDRDDPLEFDARPSPSNAPARGNRNPAS